MIALAVIAMANVAAEQGARADDGGHYCNVASNTEACLESAARSADEGAAVVEQTIGDPAGSIGDLGGSPRALCSWIENDMAYGATNYPGIGFRLAPWLDTAAICSGAVSVSLQNAITSVTAGCFCTSSGAGHWNCVGAVCTLSTQALPGVPPPACFDGYAIVEPTPGTSQVGFAPRACWA